MSSAEVVSRELESSSDKMNLKHLSVSLVLGPCAEGIKNDFNLTVLHL